jgi:hypothetical protein
VLSDTLSSTMDLIVCSSSKSFDTFVNPVSMDDSLDVIPMVSVLDSEYSERCTGVVTASVYDKFICRFSGREGAQSNSSVALFGLGVKNFSHAFGINTKLDMLLSFAMFDGCNKHFYMFTVMVYDRVIIMFKFLCHPTFDFVQNHHAEVVVGC